MTKPKLPLSSDEIKKWIPHRYPFLLIDEVVELLPAEKVVALKHVRLDDPILQGHFPGNPIYPGVLQVEGMAQAAAVLSIMSLENPIKLCLFTEIKSARFRQPVVPEAVLKYTVTVVKQRLPFFWFEAQAEVSGEIVCEASFSAKLG
jgi:3-hydroxyacyl-[acyl-carrier-protein] dehydratase